VLEVRAIVAPPIELGAVTGGRRRMVPITGGTFEGRGALSIRGRIVPGGADTQLIRDDGLTEADARYTLETETGALIEVRNRGIRHAAPEVMQKLLAGDLVDPALVYFRTTPTFETAAPDLQMLTRSIFVGTGERYPAEVVLRFFRVD
jgi:hypothetical protein